jgi:hypothetical protein
LITTLLLAENTKDKASLYAGFSTILLSLYWKRQNTKIVAEHAMKTHVRVEVHVRSFLALTLLAVTIKFLATSATMSVK